MLCGSGDSPGTGFYLVTALYIPRTCGSKLPLELVLAWTLLSDLGLGAHRRTGIYSSPGGNWTRGTRTALGPNQCVASADVQGNRFNGVLTPQTEVLV